MADILDVINAAIVAEGMTGSTDAEIAARFAETDSFDKEFVSGADIFNALDRAEWNSLTNADEQRVRDVFTLGDSIPTKAGTNVRTALLDVFRAGTTTRSNLQALISESKLVREHYGIPAQHATEAVINKARN